MCNYSLHTKTYQPVCEINFKKYFYCIHMVTLQLFIQIFKCELPVDDG